MLKMISILLSLCLSANVWADDTADYIKQNEGLRLTAYVDKHGLTSIGYGRNLTTKGISVNMAELMLREDILECEIKIFKHYPWYIIRSNEAQIVLIDMCFNLGFTGLSKFKKMVASLYEHDYVEAAKELLDSKYALSLPGRANRNAKLLRGE